MKPSLFWITTTLFALLFAAGGFADLFHVDLAMKGLRALGYPDYLATLLGLWKLLAVIALLWPRTPRLKEWAYAGIAFDLTGAAFSHAASHHSALHIAQPLIILALAAASWALRPPSRFLHRSCHGPSRCLVWRSCKQE